MSGLVCQRLATLIPCLSVLLLTCLLPACGLVSVLLLACLSAYLSPLVGDAGPASPHVRGWRQAGGEGLRRGTQHVPGGGGCSADERVRHGGRCCWDARFPSPVPRPLTPSFSCSAPPGEVVGGHEAGPGHLQPRHQLVRQRQGLRGSTPVAPGTCSHEHTQMKVDRLFLFQ